ncbi:MULTISPECIES: SCO2524 family protein [unclassified Streptomyces]|uniref:SCO2524 family protein n=1 Tax=unclassified Streptomyces TaxID=2593676 RepID=UPI002251DA0A|nr:MULTISPECIES: SCO2524 family protein [unclassified Streptomyces]MCX5048029.1 SCO2524 family protein [Streptomyces sp. NBC_00474]
MQIKPRQHLLDIWQAMARHSFDQGEWVWGEWGGRSSVADAEQLLCLLYPATEIPAFRLDDPDTTQQDVRQALKRAGGRPDIPAGLVTAATRFMRTHTGDDQEPTFAGGHYFGSADETTEITEEQRRLGVVDSFARSITLCLATLGFLKVYETRTRRGDIRKAIAELRQMTGNRLTAAMVSLLRSFTVNVFDSESGQGRALTELLGQGRLSQRQVLGKFQSRFRPLRAALVESLFLGIDIEEGLKDESQLFECGWAWSLVRDAPEVETGEPVGPQPEGIANPVPYLYFTVVALDGIQDLFSDRTLTLGLLNAEQQKLTEALRLRWELTQQYWSGIARFDDERWPLEDIPWRTTGQRLESEYFSLSVAAILVHDLMRRRATDDDLTRTVRVMERLAERGRITSRMTRDDPTVHELHTVGVQLPLQGSERLGPPMTWAMTDFSAQLLKRTVQMCTLSRNLASHERLLRLAEDVFDHMWRRRIRDGEGVGLWDDVHCAYPEAAVHKGRLPVSWSITERVTEVMVQAHGMYRRPPIRSLELTVLARALLSECAHLLGNEQLEPAPSDGGLHGMQLRNIEIMLRRARGLVDEQPGTAYALTLDVLGQLDSLARAREAADGGV